MRAFAAFATHKSPIFNKFYVKRPSFLRRAGFGYFATIWQRRSKTHRGLPAAFALAAPIHAD
jgi:hypothetical protein